MAFYQWIQLFTDRVNNLVIDFRFLSILKNTRGLVANVMSISRTLCVWVFCCNARLAFGSLKHKLGEIVCKNTFCQFTPIRGAVVVLGQGERKVPFFSSSARRKRLPTATTTTTCRPFVRVCFSFPNEIEK